MSELLLDADASWVRPGSEATVGGHSTPGGFLYVGQTLGSVSRQDVPEAALIDPTLSVDPLGSETTKIPHGVLTYSELSPVARARYLEWLIGGRTDPDAPLPFIMLFFFGLERRLLADSLSSEIARQEMPTLLDELARLLALYRSHDWFRSHAEELLALLEVVSGRRRAYASPPSAGGGRDELSPMTRIGLSQLVADEKPIPAEWALAWLDSDRSNRHRTAADRCPAEFRDLFRIRYARMHGAGLTLKLSRKRAQTRLPELIATYVPASPSFVCPVRLSLGQVTDLPGALDPPRIIRSLAHECSRDLEEYGRWMERHPASRGSISAMSLLPADLQTEATRVERDAYLRWLEVCLGDRDCVALDAETILRRLFRFVPEHLGKNEVFRITELMEKAGFGIEPDPRFGGPCFYASAKVVVFRPTQSVASGESRAYAAATILLNLAMAVAAADDEVSQTETLRLEKHLETTLHLTEPERARLAAHLRWLQEARPSLSLVKKRLKTLGPEERAKVGQFLIAVAGADGQVSPAEVKFLTKIYPLLGMNPDDIESHILGLGPGPVSRAASGLPTVLPPEPHAEFEFPPSRIEEKRFSLDPKIVQEKLGQTAAVSALLGDVFGEELGPPALPAGPPRLDPPYASLARALAEKDSWSRAEAEELAAGLGLLPDGALERINEVAFDLHGEPACEGGDPIQVNTRVIKELLA